MAGIGPKIKKVHQKVGSLLTIQGTATQEYCIFNAVSSQNPAYLTSHQWIAGIHYDTAISVGNILIIDDGRKMLVVSLSPDVFKNAVTEYKGGVIEINKTLDIKRASRTQHATTKEWTTAWAAVVSGVDAVAIDSGAGRVLAEKEFGMIVEHDLTLFIASSHAVKVKDRIVIGTSNFEVIEKSEYQTEGVDLCLLNRDGRE